jgi:hypothetical protein
MKLEFSQQIFAKYSSINFMKIHPVGAELLCVDRQTDLKLVVSFCNVANVPKNYVVETNHSFTTSHTSDSCLADKFSDVSDIEIKGSSIAYV